MIAGLLRHSITIKTRTLSKNPIGESVETFTTLKTVRAAIKQISSDTAHMADGERITTKTQFRIRYQPIFDQTDIVVFKGVTYDNLSIENTLGMNREMIITGEAVR